MSKNFHFFSSKATYREEYVEELQNMNLLAVDPKSIANELLNCFRIYYVGSCFVVQIRD